MVRYAMLLVLTILLVVPIRSTESGSFDLDEMMCERLDQIELKLYEEERERERKERELLRYTDYHRNQGILHNFGVDVDKYLSIIAFKESSDNYRALNRLGYMGKYQFGRSTLRGLKKYEFLDFKKEEIATSNFLANTVLQDAAMNALTAYNTNKLLVEWGLSPYLGKTVGGVKITLEGMLAASHLLGPYAVKHYLENKGSMKSVTIKVEGEKVLIRKYDGNGTSLKDYMSMFSMRS